MSDGFLRAGGEDGAPAWLHHAERFRLVLDDPKALEDWRANSDAGRTELLNQHAERLSDLASSLTRQELEAQERETTFSTRMNMLLERENAASRMEGELTRRAETSTEREGGISRMEAELARRAEASMQREVAVLKREENLAEEAAYYRELPMFKQAIQFRAWLRQRKG